MLNVNRRNFLGCSMLGLTAAMFGERTWAAHAEPVARDSLFLTWQRDPTTTMTVQWIGQKEEVKVEYAPMGDDAAAWKSTDCRVRPYPQTELHAHRAEISGLTPDTEYRFRVGASPQQHRFRTMPAKATKAIQYISGGDSGVDEHAVNNNIQAAKQDPMFVVMAGDLGYDDGRKADTSLKFMRNYSRHMIDTQGRMIPLLVCMGNHEVDGGYGKPRKDAPFFYALHDGLFSETSYNVLDFGDYMSIVLLDTGHNSPIGGEQTSWLEKTLKERQNCPNLLVYNHVPAYPSVRPFSTDNSAGTGAENRKFWSPLFERYNVDVVFEHHDHTFKRTKPMLGGLVDERRGLVYLGDGSWGKLRPIRDPEKRPFLAAYNSSYHFSLHHIEGAERFHKAMDESGKVIDVCKTAKRPQTKVS